MSALESASKSPCGLHLLHKCCSRRIFKTSARQHVYNHCQKNPYASVALKESLSDRFADCGLITRLPKRSLSLVLPMTSWYRLLGFVTDVDEIMPDNCRERQKPIRAGCCLPCAERLQRPTAGHSRIDPSETEYCEMTT